MMRSSFSSSFALVGTAAVGLCTTATSTTSAAAPSIFGNTRRMYTTGVLPRGVVVSKGASLTPGRSLFTCSRVVLDEAGKATDTANENAALDVAMYVNRLKKSHQSAGGGNISSGEGSRASIEKEAWERLNGLTEAEINQADGKAVSLLLNSWAYFAKFWAKGKDGP